MSIYAQFEPNLRWYLDGNLKRAHIKEAFSKGYRKVDFNVSVDGSMSFFFEGESRYSRSFRSVEDFYKRSEILGDLEGLGYALVTSCISAEKSVIVVPSKYNVVVHIDGVGDFWFHINVN